MFSLIGWLVYGLIVGLIAKALHPGDDPVGFSWTLGVGVGGSFIGGFINWVMGNGYSPISSSGILMGVVGGVIFLAAWRWWRLRSQNLSFTGRRLR
tara:strand:+ start:5698 stop:5985 length:288 start_codon:yes stop_codon:yes gene_type:complete